MASSIGICKAVQAKSDLTVEGGIEKGLGLFDQTKSTFTSPHKLFVLHVHCDVTTIVVLISVWKIENNHWQFIDWAP